MEARVEVVEEVVVVIVVAGQQVEVVGVLVL